MLKSLRWRLQAWHALILVTVLLVFGVSVYALQRQSRLQQIDLELQRSLRMVHKSVQSSVRGRPGYRGPGGEGARRAMDGKMSPGAGKVSVPAKGSGRGPGRFSEFRKSLDRDKGGAGRRMGMPKVSPDRMIPQIELSAKALAIFDPDDESAQYFIIWRYDGRTLKASEAAPDVPFPGPNIVEDGKDDVARMRGQMREVLRRDRFMTIVVGRSIAPELAAQTRLAWMLIGAGAGVLLVGLLGGWWLSLKAVRPIQTISEIAESISADDLSKRIDLGETESELGQLATVLNSTFDRLQASFEQQIQFTADASHELRTPLSVMLTSAQLALSKQREADEYRESLETSLRASKRMKSLVDGLLTLAHIDGGRFELNRSEFDLGSLAGECIELLQPLARERGINIESQLQQVMVNGDSDRLAQVLTNLLTNAVRYNRDGGTVTLSIRQDDRATVVSVADTGLGIPADDLPNIFDRFYRVDKVRSRADGGSGLGLSICRTIVEAHEGAITATSKLGSGTCLEIRLPRNNGVQS